MATLRTNLLYQQAKQCLESRDFTQAEQLSRKLLRRNKRDHNALQVLGSCAYAKGDYEKAVEYLKQCIALQPRDPLFLCHLALVRTAEGKPDAAVACYDRALKVRPGFPVAIGGKAVTLENAGDSEAALALLQPYIEDGAEDPSMALAYAKLKYDAGAYSDAIDVARRHTRNAKIDPVIRRDLLFILGKTYEKAQRIDEAFEAFQQANTVRALPCDPNELGQQIESLIKSYSPEKLANYPRAATKSELPVFIVGMPRSGSTLTEKIIASHPQVHGAGEITAFGEIPFSMMYDLGSYQPYPQCMADLTQEWTDRFAATYLKHISDLQRDAVRVVNKMLSNYKNLGLISVLLPRARIIHTKRNALDNCWSCFAENLSPVKHRYASDLRNLGLIYRQYERLMEHWKEVLDIQFMEVQYEEMVADPEDVSRKLIEFLGLPWDERCLRFYESSGQRAPTLSYQQVRQPIYKSAVRRYERYGALLDPLREALGLRDDGSASS
ncbi:MAG: sulfotransferase [Planctomycetota bacterium]|nr:sulfotransferase [Planctomycetota bacterium]